MDTNTRKIVGFACMAICVVALFVAIERYQSNATNVKAMNQMPMARLFNGGAELQPATPTVTKYALLVAFLSLIGGGICLYTVYLPDHFEKDDEPAEPAPQSQSNSDQRNAP